MIGLLIAFCWLALSMVFGYSFAESFLNATSFLFLCYTIITGLLFVICVATITFIGIVASSQSHGVIGFLLGIFLGITAGTILAVVALAKNLLLILGSYALCTSVVLNPLEPPVWNLMQLILGAVCLLIGIIAIKWPIQKSNS